MSSQPIPEDNSESFMLISKNPQQRREWAVHNLDRMQINWDALPRLPPWSFISGYRRESYRVAVATRVMNLAASLNRPLEPIELDHVSRLIAKSVVTTTYSTPAWLATAFVLERRGRATYRMPFYTPKAEHGFESTAFPWKGVSLFSGAQAQRAWHVARFGLYAAWSKVLFDFFFRSYANGVFAVGMMQDPELQEMNNTLRGQAQEQFARTRRQAEERRQRSDPRLRRQQEQSGQNTIQTQEDELSVDAGRAVDKLRGQIQGLMQELPRGAAQEFRQEARDVVRRGDADEMKQFVEDRQAQRNNTWQQTDRQADSVSSWPDAGPSNPVDRQEERTMEPSTDDGYLFDDASPVAPSQRQMQRSRQSQGASSWDSIRQSARAGETRSGERQPAQDRAPRGGWASVREGNASNRDTSGEYTFSSAEAERATSKSQAQKDFDAMLDRERAGESDTGYTRRR
jgi:hypothetical protein